jgi:hypothetical protein
MVATIQLFLALDMRSALVAEAAMSAAGLVIAAAITRRRRRAGNPVPASLDVVAEAETVVRGAVDHQPA